MAGGSTDALWFTDADHGWLTDIEPTAPDAMLFVTADGGRHWHVVADTDRHAVIRSLPTIGRVQYQPGGTTAWDAAPAGWFSPDLYVTRNGGDTWQTALAARHRVSLHRVSSAARWSSPSAGARTAPVRARLVVSGDDGAHWTREPTVILGAGSASDHSGSGCQSVAAAVPESPTTLGWPRAPPGGGPS